MSTYIRKPLLRILFIGYKIENDPYVLFSKENDHTQSFKYKVFPTNCLRRILIIERNSFCILKKTGEETAEKRVVCLHSPAFCRFNYTHNQTSQNNQIFLPHVLNIRNKNVLHHYLYTSQCPQN